MILIQNVTTTVSSHRVWSFLIIQEISLLTSLYSNVYQNHSRSYVLDKSVYKTFILTELYYAIVNGIFGLSFSVQQEITLISVLHETFSLTLHILKRSPMNDHRQDSSVLKVKYPFGMRRIEVDFFQLECSMRDQPSFQMSLYCLLLT